MNIIINLNGRLQESGAPLIAVQNRSFRFGDGLFETMKCLNGNIPFQQYHFERLFTGMQDLKFETPVWLTADFLLAQVKQVIASNQHEERSRIRLMVFSGNGGLYETNNRYPNFLIESFPLPGATTDGAGLVIDLYLKARKSQDAFSSIKSNNFLPYVMAAIYAKEQGLDDAVILNSNERICDASVANIFIVKNNRVYTPALSEGCIAGVMRRYLIEKMTTSSCSVEETTVSQEALFSADEIFLTNAISGIRSVKRCGNINLTCNLTKEIKQLFLNDF